MMKTKRNIELYREEAQKLNLEAEYMQASAKKHSLYISDGTRFFLINTVTPGFYPENKRWNAHFTGSKLLTQKILKKFGYKTIRSDEIRISAYHSIRSMNAELRKKSWQFPCLIKPDRGKDGLGIDIATNQSELIRAAKAHYERRHDFLIQPIVDKPEYRILVIDQEVVLMHSKHNPYVIGDGTSTVSELLRKVPKRRANKTFIAWQYKKLNLKPSSVLAQGARFEYHLTKVATPDYYRTENFPAAVRKWALKLADTISSPVVGIDLFIPGALSDTKNYVIIELNSNPALYHLPKRFNDHVTGPKIINKILKDYFNIN